MRRHALPDIDMRQALAERGLECHLLLPDNQAAQLCEELSPLLEAAYGRTPTPSHFTYETWAVTLRPLDPPLGKPVACCTLAFRQDFPSFFCVRFEAVHPSVQGTGLGRLLFDCTAIWTRFLLLNDPLVTEGVMQSSGSYCLVAYIDIPEQGEDDWEGPEDNEHGHGAFLKRLGFVRAQHDFGQTLEEIAFQRTFHVPILDLLAQELPPRPATA